MKKSGLIKQPKNFCRNPSNHTTAWCYTMIHPEGNGKWENCDIPKCSDDSIWFRGTEILNYGICATDRDLPCCKTTWEEKFKFGRAGRLYPKCRLDGYFYPKQCNYWKGTPDEPCYCVDKTGKYLEKKGTDKMLRCDLL